MDSKTSNNRLFLFILLCCTASFIGCSVSTASKEPYGNAALEQAKLNVRRYNINGNSSCSGTIVSKNLFITAAHCIPSSEDLEVAPGVDIISLPPTLELAVGNTRMLPDFVMHYTDGAVLTGDFNEAFYPEVDNTAGLVYEVDEAILCGYPMFSSELRCTKAKRVSNSRFAALYQASVIPGQSGGAVFSLDGKLIGIIQYMTDEGLAGVGSVTGLLSGVGRSK